MKRLGLFLAGILVAVIVAPLLLYSADQPAPPAPPVGWTAPPAPVVTPAPANDGQLMAAAASRNFGKTLNQAATEAYKAGEISRGELARVRLAILLRPRVIAECQSCVLDEGMQRGVIPANSAENVGAMDWTQLLAFIKEMLPMILQIISLFSSQASTLAPFAPLALAA